MTEHTLYHDLSQLLPKEAKILKHLDQIIKSQKDSDSKSWYNKKGRDVASYMVLDGQCEYCSYRDFYYRCDLTELEEAQKQIAEVLNGIVITTVNIGYGYSSLKSKFKLVEELITLKKHKTELPDLYPSLSYDLYHKESILNPTS